MITLLLTEYPEGPDNDQGVVGLFATEEAAKAYAQESEDTVRRAINEPLEPIEWDVNPSGDYPDPGFGSTGGSGMGWRVRQVEFLG
jgi:hypothetical protein